MVPVDCDDFGETIAPGVVAGGRSGRVLSCTRPAASRAAVIHVAGLELEVLDARHAGSRRARVLPRPPGRG